MCEYGGCRGVEPIAELMREHYARLDEAHLIRKAMAPGDRETAYAHVRRPVKHLALHVRREEQDIFTALREQNEFVDEVEHLEDEHRAPDAGIAALAPATVVSLGARRWELVEAARADHPTFLEDDRAGTVTDHAG